MMEFGVFDVGHHQDDDENLARNVAMRTRTLLEVGVWEGVAGPNTEWSTEWHCLVGFVYFIPKKQLETKENMLLRGSWYRVDDVLEGTMFFFILEFF